MTLLRHAADVERHALMVICPGCGAAEGVPCLDRPATCPQRFTIAFSLARLASRLDTMRKVAAALEADAARSRQVITDLRDHLVRLETYEPPEEQAEWRGYVLAVDRAVAVANSAMELLNQN